MAVLPVTAAVNRRVRNRLECAISGHSCLLGPNSNVAHRDAGGGAVHRIISGHRTAEIEATTTAACHTTRHPLRPDPQQRGGNEGPDIGQARVRRPTMMRRVALSTAAAALAGLAQSSDGTAQSRVMPVAQMRAALETTARQWIQFRNFNGHQWVYFTGNDLARGCSLSCGH